MAKRDFDRRWKVNFTSAEFTPAEVERVATLSTAMQRDWRQRGFIRKAEGHARFSPFEVAEIWVMKMLSDRGLGPAVTKQFAPQAADAIVYNAARWETRHLAIGGIGVEELFDTYPGDGRPLTEREIGNLAIVAQLNSAAEKSGKSMALYKLDHPERYQPYEPGPDDKIDWILERIFAQLGRTARAARDLTWWPNGEVEIDGLSNLAERKIERLERFTGAAIVLPVAELGYLFAHRAEKSLFVLLDRGPSK